MLFLDGVYVERPDGSVRFRGVKAPSGVELTDLAHYSGLPIIPSWACLGGESLRDFSTLLGTALLDYPR